MPQAREEGVCFCVHLLGMRVDTSARGLPELRGGLRSCSLTRLHCIVGVPVNVDSWHRAYSYRILAFAVGPHRAVS